MVKNKKPTVISRPMRKMIMGVRMGQVFALAKEFIEMPPGDKEERDRY